MRVRLCSLHAGETGVIESVSAACPLRKTLMAMGAVPGQTVTVVHHTDPMVIRLQHIDLALRKKEAADIWLSR